MLKQNVLSVPATVSKRWVVLPLVALMLTTFSGCSIMPQPLSNTDRQARIFSDMDALFKDVEPVTGPLSLHEALARALKYNYDARLKLMEEALSNAQLDLSHYDLLPRLTASAGYASRNNDALSGSVLLNNGSLISSGTFSGAQERSRKTIGAAFTWNILDFGVSYVRAQQQAAKSLMANERKRKVVQNVMQDVRQAYWRAYGAQKTLPRLNALLSQVDEALKRSRSMEKQRLMAPEDALTYQRSLIDLYQQIVTHRQALLLAKPQLASLINVKPGTEIILADSEEMKLPANLHLLDDMDALDQAALANRPELREEDYRKRVTVLEARRALYSILPGIDITASSHHDSNRYLYKNNWTEAGASISFNLLRVFSYPSMKRAQAAQAKLDDTRRIALSMAVLTQVRIAGQRYQESIVDYDINTQSAQVDARIEKIFANGVKADAKSEMDLLRVQVKAALSEMQRYASYAEMQTAYARIANSVGADMLPDSPDMSDIKTFAKQLAQVDEAWRKGDFKVADEVSQLAVDNSIKLLASDTVAHIGDSKVSPTDDGSILLTVEGDMSNTAAIEVK